jgi:WW domain-binding protein 4
MTTTHVHSHCCSRRQQQHVTSVKAIHCCLACCCPLQVGGYQLHSIQGAIGGAKGVGSLAGGGAAGTAAGASADTKRKRDGAAGGGAAAAGGGKELSKEDREFLARREAARARVQQRTAASFGLT